MKVKIGDKVFSSEDQPIMVIFEKNEKDLVVNMDEASKKFCVYDEDLDAKFIIQWMKEDGVHTTFPLDKDEEDDD